MLQIRSRIDRWFALLAVALPLGCIASAWTVEQPAARRYVLYYAMPLTVIVPVWGRLRLVRFAALTPTQRVADALVLIAATVRTLGGDVVPVSGHALFLTHTIVTTRNKYYRMAATGASAITLWFKLRIWNDRSSLVAGVLAGGMTALVWMLSDRAKDRSAKRRAR